MATSSETEMDPCSDLAMELANEGRVGCNLSSLRKGDSENEICTYRPSLGENGIEQKD